MSGQDGLDLSAEDIDRLVAGLESISANCKAAIDILASAWAASDDDELLTRDEAPRMLTVKPGTHGRGVDARAPGQGGSS